MGWVWSDDDSDDTQLNSSSGDINLGSGSGSGSGSGCPTRKIVRSQCRTEEVEPGKFVRKCEKTEELLRNCIGKPVEVLQSNKEYTEEDITDEVLKGRSATFGSSNSSLGRGVFDFPGLRSDIEAIERDLFSGFSRFFDVAAEEMKNGFFDIFAKSPPVFDAESSSSSSMRRGIPVEEYGRQEAYPKSKDTESEDTDFAALAKDV